MSGNVQVSIIVVKTLLDKYILRTHTEDFIMKARTEKRTWQQFIYNRPSFYTALPKTPNWGWHSHVYFLKQRPSLSHRIFCLNLSISYYFSLHSTWSRSFWPHSLPLFCIQTNDSRGTASLCLDAFFVYFLRRRGTNASILSQRRTLRKRSTNTWILG